MQDALMPSIILSYDSIPGTRPKGAVGSITRVTAKFILSMSASFRVTEKGNQRPTAISDETTVAKSTKNVSQH
jgi:hypothetical protein